MVSRYSSNEMLQQSAGDENDIILIGEEGPDDTRYSVSQQRSEVSCIVCICSQKQFINIMGANCRNDVLFACSRGSRMTAATSRQGQQNEGSSQPSGAAERGQQQAARGSSQPPGTAERGQQPAARGSRTRAAAGRQGQQNEGSKQPPGAVERGQ